MIVLRYALMVLGIIGAILTLPVTPFTIFTPICMAFIALAWFSRRIGRRREAPQSSQAAPTQDP